MSNPLVKCTRESMEMIFENSNIDDDTKIKFLVANYESMRPFKSYLTSTPKVKKYFDFLCTNRSAKKIISLTDEEIKFCIRLNPNTIGKLDLSKYDSNKLEDIIHCVIKKGFGYNNKASTIISDNAKLLTSREVAILLFTSASFLFLVENNKFKLSDDDWRIAFGLDTGNLKSFYYLECDVNPVIQKEYFIATCKRWLKFKNRHYLFDHLQDIFYTFYKVANKEPLISALIELQHKSSSSGYHGMTDECWTDFLVEQVNNRLLSVQEAEICGAKLPESMKLLHDL